MTSTRISLRDSLRRRSPLDIGRIEPAGFAMAWRGTLAIVFGTFALSGAAGSVRTLALAFGAYAAFEATGAFWAALGLSSRSLLVISAVDAAAAGYFLILPTPSLHAVAYVLGAWAMLTGILELFAAGVLRRFPALVRFQAAAGVVSILLGVVLAFHPVGAPSELAGLLGTTIAGFGCLCLLAAGHFRRGMTGGVWTARVGRGRAA